VHAGVRYQLEGLVGAGGMGSAYLARRDGPEGSSAVVVKLVNPSLAGGQVAPELVAMKEAFALGRLNEVVPPTPFVVRFVDAGNAAIFSGFHSPWTAIEYVHGGVEGTTLEDRVTYSLHKTGYGFDPPRAAHAVRCLAGGLTAIHGVGVIHRDVSPGNVLCCGFGEAEIFKIADFGIARASGLAFTFQGLTLGTLGYSAPESTLAIAGPASDVFSFAAIVYYLLTGQQYFEVEHPMEAREKAASEKRTRLSDNSTLVPELVERPQACLEIDRALARATALSASQRPQNAAQFAASILPWLGDANAAPRSSRRLLTTLGTHDTLPASEHAWIVKSHASPERVITSAAWDTDGHALVLSPQGALFWNGHSFLDARRLIEQLPGQVSFVQRYQAGGWLLGGSSATLSVVDAGGVTDSVVAPRSDTSFELASGRFDDVFVAVGRRANGTKALFALSNRRWLKGLELPGVAAVLTLQQLDETRWLVAGRLHENRAFAALYSPLQVELEMLALPSFRAVIGGAGVAERSTALLVGSEGVALRFDKDGPSLSTLPGAPELSAAALDILNREWAASVGALWSRNAGTAQPWQIMWQSPDWKAPFVSMMADVGIVLAMTADGAIVEGRSASRAPSVTLTAHGQA
jgi:eukaryotic-like serine/threonine-protein kinase